MAAGRLPLKRRLGGPQDRSSFAAAFEGCGVCCEDKTLHANAESTAGSSKKSMNILSEVHFSLNSLISSGGSRKLLGLPLPEPAALLAGLGPGACAPTTVCGCVGADAARGVKFESCHGV